MERLLFESQTVKFNWEQFFDNSSTHEALLDFAYNHICFKQFSEDCWTKECKKSIKLMRHMGYKKTRQLAQRALLCRGFCKKEFI